MKAKGKKLIALFLVFSLVMLSANLYAKERRGAKLIVTKLDGQLIEGELITVKPSSLLLLDRKSGADVSVNIADIKVIRIVKKSRAGKGALYGLLVGIGGAALIGSSIDAPSEDMSGFEAGLLIGLIITGPISALVGGLIGASAGKDKTIRIEGMSDSEIEEALDKLRKKARIRDYK